MNYYEKLALLDKRDFFSLFLRLGVEPRWVHSAGKEAIQVIGACHGGENHSALFDPETLKVHCFSMCGETVMLHNWVRKAINLDSPHEAQEYLEEWIDNEDIDLSGRVGRRLDFEYKEGDKYEPGIIPVVPGMLQAALEEIYSGLDTSLETLSRLVWHTRDGIDSNILKLFDVGYSPKSGSIILPHHNSLGEIVGIYERSFRPLRRKIKEQYPDMPFKDLLKYPRAKYVPLLRGEKYMDKEGHKTSWSFPNSQNLYGLHLAKDEIAKSGKAFIFEGGKSVMLARQYGYPASVATHTFGAHLNHISMLIGCGAKEICLLFDKQYREESGVEWELYEKKTRDLAAKVGEYCTISRVRDINNLIDYKDAPIDKGKEVFERLLKEGYEVLSAAPQEIEEEEWKRERRKKNEEELFAASSLLQYL